MCRHLAYLGPPITLEQLVLVPDHSLLRQASQPQYQSHGTVNADGFGVGWYDLERRREPARYRATRPIWTDHSFASFAGLISSTAVLASVRSASPGFPVEESGTAPFVDGAWLFAHNGIVPGSRTGVGRELRQHLSEKRAMAILGATDSELLFAMTLDRIDGGAEPGEALAEVIKSVEALTTARLNMVITDGERVAATAWRNSLFVLDNRLLDGAVVVASEPYDTDPAWEALADRSLVEVDAESTRIRSL
jgi:glutamine amidotransferase